MRQQRLLSRLPRLGEQSAPVAIRRSDEASRHVVAEKRDGGGVAAVGPRARAAGLGGILGVGERRLRAEGVRTERESSILEPATWLIALQAPARELRADVLDHLPLPRNELQRLGHVTSSPIFARTSLLHCRLCVPAILEETPGQGCEDYASERNDVTRAPRRLRRKGQFPAEMCYWCRRVFPEIHWERPQED
jgi:hypothetical protein